MLAAVSKSEIGLHHRTRKFCDRSVICVIISIVIRGYAHSHTAWLSLICLLWLASMQ